MRNAAFTITFTPIATAIICSVLITLGDFVNLLPVWLLWEILLFSAIAAFIAVTSLLVAWFAQWLILQILRLAI